MTAPAEKAPSKSWISSDSESESSSDSESESSSDSDSEDEMTPAQKARMEKKSQALAEKIEAKSFDEVVKAIWPETKVSSEVIDLTEE